MANIAVVDYGMGNLRSVAKALEHVAPESTVVVTAEPQEIHESERIVFPGQGAMPDCVREIDKRGLREPLLEAARSKPFLGLLPIRSPKNWSPPENEQSCGPPQDN